MMQKSSLQNHKLKNWIDEVQALCEPDQIHICDGSAEENSALCQQLVDNQTFIPLSPEKGREAFWPVPIQEM